jgi:hypothetical protein
MDDPCHDSYAPAAPLQGARAATVGSDPGSSTAAFCQLFQIEEQAAAREEAAAQ